MFSGIVEGVQPVVTATTIKDTVQIEVQRPVEFDDIKIGDSISMDGVCLTVETFDQKTIQFTLGFETLNITGWTADFLLNKQVNLERSLRLGDRIHGHLVSGHVDGRAEVVSVEKGESWLVVLEVKNFARQFMWPKGSVTFNGVSLTVNNIEGAKVSVGLIPETLKRTNLQFLKNGDGVNVEYDLWAKAFVNYQENRTESKSCEERV